MNLAQAEQKRIDQEIAGRPFDEATVETIKAQRQELFEVLEQVKQEVTLAKKEVEELKKRQERWRDLQKKKSVGGEKKEPC